MNTEIANFLSEQGYADETERTYKNLLTRLLTKTDPASLSSAGLVEFLRTQGWENSRQCVALAASRKFITWKYGVAHPALRARIKRTKPKLQPSLTEEQAMKLLASFDTSTAIGARNLSMAALWLDTGLRVSEMCRVLLADMNLDYKIRFANTEIRCGLLQVVVKGGDWASAIFSMQTAQYIREWLSFPVERKPDAKTVFVSMRTHARLTPEGLWKVVSEWGKQVDWGEEKVVLSPHVFRRAFADLATLFGGPSRIVQIGGRWSDIRRVESYTRNLQLLAMIPYLPVSNMMR